MSPLSDLVSEVSAIADRREDIVGFILIVRRNHAPDPELEDREVICDELASDDEVADILSDMADFVQREGLYKSPGGALN